MDRWCLIAALLLLMDRAASVQQTRIFVRVGGKLSLTPKIPTHIERLTNIVWMLNRDLVGEWTEGTVDFFFYPAFANRSQLDVDVARLEIDVVTAKDSGVYSVDLNNRVQPGTFLVSVLREVTKPLVQKTPLTCSDRSELCTLACEGNVTEVGEVTYSWKMDEGEWLELGQKMNVTKHDTKTKEFFCQMANQIGMSQSDGISNPFLKVPNSKVIVVVLVVLLFLFLFLGGVVFWKREAFSICFASLKDRGGPAGNEMSGGARVDGDEDVKQELKAEKRDSEDAEQPQNS